MALVGCSVQESTRSGGLIAPSGPAVTATSPVSTIVTVTVESTGGTVASTAKPAASTGETGEAAAVTADIAGSAVEAVEQDAEPALPTTEAEAAAVAGVREVLAAAEPPPGFGEGVLGVTGPSGTRVWPVLVADTPQSRQRGLMGVADFATLGGYAAMVFIFEDDTSGAFWMRDTPLPLRITFVSANGSVVSGADMVPCLAPTPSEDCAHYHPDGPYRIAIEHPLDPAFDIGLMSAEFVEVTVE